MTENQEPLEDNSWADEFDLDTDDTADGYVSPLASGTVESVDTDDTNDDFTDIIDVVDAEVESPTVEGILVDESALAVVDLEEHKDLSVEEAQELTEHIRSAADMLYVLVARAHAGKAHIALGYGNFADYVRDEFDISRSRAYQFLNQASVIAAVEASTPLGTKIKITEAAARDIKNLIDELAPELKERTEGMSPDEAGDVVEELVNDYRERSKKPLDEEVDLSDIDLDDIDFDLPEFDGESSGGGNKSDFENMENFDNLDDLLNDDEDDSGFNEDPSSFRNKVENVYAFYTALTALEKMPDVSEIISAVPDARKSQIDSSLPKALAWLTQANQVWNDQKEDKNVDLDQEIELEDDIFEFPEDEDVREQLNYLSDDFTDIESEQQGLFNKILFTQSTNFRKL